MRRYLAVLATAGVLALPSLALAAGGAQLDRGPQDPPPPCPSAAPNQGSPQPCGPGQNGGGGGSAGKPPPCPSAAPNQGRPQPCGHPSGGGNPSNPPPCPSSAPNAGGQQPCGHASPSPSPSPSPGGGGGTSPSPSPSPSGGGGGSACPKGLLPVNTVNASPVAFICVAVLPSATDNPNFKCPTGAQVIALPANPVLFLCVTLGPSERRTA